MNNLSCACEEQKKSLSLARASEQGTSLKKKRKKKKDTDTLETSQATAPVLVRSNRRPGKKKMRKLRYQQQHLSPMEFLLNSSQACQFTGSVVATNPLPAANNRFDDSSSFGSTVVQVVTSCVTIPTTIEIDTIPSLKTGCCTTVVQQRIHVQPLMVLDLNGILCHRMRFVDSHYNRAPTSPSNIPPTTTSSYRDTMTTATKNKATVIAGTPIIARPGLTEFLSFLDLHFCLAVWTSAKQKTATALVKALFPSHIADRLLFIWTQHHCDTVIVSVNDNGEGVSNIDKKTIYEKNLEKVWKEYPLWNAQTTILMDDSPTKCQKWHENAIHPPALHGIQASHLCNTGEGVLLPDEDNVQRQREFLQGLVQRFMDAHVVTEWTVSATTTALPCFIGAAETEAVEETKKPFKVTSPPILLDYLRAEAVGRMGWV